MALQVMAQPHFTKPHGLYDVSSLTVGIEGSNAQQPIYYTTDGSTPTLNSQRYTQPLQLTETTLLRAAEQQGDSLSPIATASYLFVGSVLSQSDSPEGYPDTWGQYTEQWGWATADYGMDPEMTGDPVLGKKIADGLKTLPILSIVTDKDNLFSHEEDSLRGGIYIFTGPPVGDATGHGWTRPASVELFGPSASGALLPHDLSATCGLRLHGGHGRLAEKNPKHSFRLVFKKEYGQKTLQYPLYGDDEPSKFNQLVLRCHFGNSWQHWAEGNRKQAQYTRDVWARRMQRKMGHTSVNALYVHLFLNGMYWGLYNVAERVDDQFGKDHLGGKKSDIDVVKVEEDGGNHIEASEGTLDAWNLMTETAARAADNRYYEQLDTLLDIGNFIDYMLINQYGGNTDWDHHNWYALRSRGAERPGFRFLCWDSEIILENVATSVLGTRNGNRYLTGIFNNPMQNEQFARRYLKRAKELLADDGLLGQQHVVELWDSLYNTISLALYDEAARWGDYRRDVHPWQSRGQLYTVDEHYMAERNRLLTQYFPYRSERVLSNIIAFVDIDDFEAPDNWSKLTASMFHEWDGTGSDARPLDKEVNVDWNIGANVGGGGAVAGFVNVEHNRFADLSDYEALVLHGSGSGLRILANRLVAHGPWKQIIVDFNENSPYWDVAVQGLVFPLSDLQTVTTNEDIERYDEFVHLNALKVNWSNNVTVRGAWLVPKADLSGIAAIRRRPSASGSYHTLSGQLTDSPVRGRIYIRNGKKVIVR